MTGTDPEQDCVQPDGAATQAGVRAGGIYAVIPIKQIADAKQRLAGLLSSSQRSGLFRAMVGDVLEVATSCDALDGCVVVTDDAEVRELAARFGALIRPEPETRGLIPAVTETGAWLRASKAAAMVFLPADIPLATTAELAAAVDAYRRAQEGSRMIVAPAEDLGGTNLLLTAPPGCMRFALGLDSYRKHMTIAREAGITPVTLMLEGVGLDVDFPRDLHALVARGGGAPRTRSFLDSSGTIDQLERAASSGAEDNDNTVGLGAT